MPGGCGTRCETRAPSDDHLVLHMIVFIVASSAAVFADVMVAEMYMDGGGVEIG